MLSFEKLNEQNHKITELSHVVLHLIKERSMCDLDTTCDIFFMFVKSVNEHFKLEDTSVYGKLLSYGEENVNKVGSHFMSGSVEIKKIFQSYIKKWCHNNRLRIKNHEKFVKETEDMMRLVLNRVQDETENLYPLVRKVDQEQAA